MRKSTKIVVLLVMALWLLAGQNAWASALEVQVNHLNLSLTPEGNLHVTEQYLLVNHGEAFSEEGILHFLLPLNATNIHYGAGIDESKARVEGQKLILNQEVLAGDNTLNFHYVLEVETGMPHFNWEREFYYDTVAFFIMSSVGELQVISEGLDDQGAMDMGGKQIHVYAGSFQEGDKLGLVVVPDMVAPGASEPADTAGVIERETAPAFHDPGHVRLWEKSIFSGIDAHLFLFLVIGLPLGVLIWYLWKRRQEKDIKTDAEREEEVFQRFLLREKHLKQKLVELEEEFAEGTVNDQEYKEQLELYKKKILEVRIKLKQFTE